MTTQSAHDAEMQAYNKATENVEAEALTFRDARIGPYRVGERFHTGQRFRYPVTHKATGRTRMLTGNEVVRLARQARQDGLLVVMTPPWRDEEGVA